MRFRFGDCVLDAETHELLREGRGVRVSPKAFQLLSVLIEQRPKALSKDELHAVLWPKTFVADTTLTGLVKEIRAAVGDDARSPRFIRTIAAFGYAFSGEGREVRRAAPTGFFCRLIGLDSQVGLVDGDNILGRGPESVLWIDDETVSRRHARIRVEKETAVLEDLASHNGTFVGERRIDSPAELRDGDRIRLGSYAIRFRASSSPGIDSKRESRREKARRKDAVTEPTSGDRSVTLQRGSRIGPYEIVSLLGAGGMGEVYRARDARLDREVAVKVLPAQLAESPQALSRFEREAKAVAALSHSNILAIHDFGNDGGVVYAVMELLDGETVADRLLHGPIPWRRTAEIGVAVAEGLSVAHKKGIVHRDLKPQNLFLMSDDRVKILDFGLARHDRAVAAGEETSADTQTGTVPGTIMGTVGYMAPEQVRGDPTDARTDVFSLGCVLYEMATGQRAFRRRTAADTMAAVLNEEPTAVPESGPIVPDGFVRVIARCLEKNPESRFQTARDLAFALKEALGGSETVSATPAPTAAPARPAEPRKDRSRIGIAAAVVVGLAALALALNLGGLRQRLAPRRAIESVAVLPFSNLSGDSQQEFFADGMTEQIRTNLARLGELRVISRTSALSAKASKKPLPQIARELNVDAVVEGSVVRVGDRVKVTAELFQASSDKNLWEDAYERDVRDIVTLQGEIAGAIARKVGVELTPRTGRGSSMVGRPIPWPTRRTSAGATSGTRWTRRVSTRPSQSSSGPSTSNRPMPRPTPAWPMRTR